MLALETVSNYIYRVGSEKNILSVVLVRIKSVQEHKMTLWSRRKCENNLAVGAKLISKHTR